MDRGRGRGTATAVMGKISPIRQPVHQAIELHSPVTDRLGGFITANRVGDPRMVPQGECQGRTLALCGAGPSLATADISGVDEIFACNSAVAYLRDRGISVTGAVGIDQTLGLLREWAEPIPSIPYFVASSCDPETIQHLRSRGCSLRWFHNYIGLANEVAIYNETWPAGYMVGQGMTVVSRFIGMALWMGFERIDVYGADCAFGPNDQAHANGEHADAAYGNPLIMTGKLPPSDREWRTRPDMLRDAVHLVKRMRESGGRIRLVGDTLPVALLGKDDAYLDQVSRTLAPGETIPALTTTGV